MVTTIIFSKDRAAQLDLLLSSGKKYAPGLFSHAHVIWAASNQDFNDAYQVCMREWSDVRFHPETDFARDLYELLDRPERYVMFLCDDDIFYRPLQDPFPTTILAWRPDVLSVSLRLGKNTTHCYSLSKPQQTPQFDHERHALLWDWRGEEADWGYPGSLDGNIWRTTQLWTLLGGESPENPNKLEDLLSSACRRTLIPKLACYKASILFGNPVNMVNSTHRTNRHADMFPHSVRSLNSGYLDGMRLSVNSIDPSVVVAAHCEQRLVFNLVKAAVV